MFDNISLVQLDLESLLKYLCTSFLIQSSIKVEQATLNAIVYIQSNLFIIANLFMDIIFLLSSSIRVGSGVFVSNYFICISKQWTWYKSNQRRKMYSIFFSFWLLISVLISLILSVIHYNWEYNASFWKWCIFMFTPFWLPLRFLPNTSYGFNCFKVVVSLFILSYIHINQ